ncbi:MAG: hypothetical protein JF603_02845 [Acidobacteria bacterium]|nr:hypothetical protein [Acidobacteriota bacterium]
MAIYVPAGRRRRSLLLSSAAVLLVGLLAGFGLGRATAPTVDDRVRSVRTEAREIAAGLRVISLHEQAGAGDVGARLVLQRTRTQVAKAFGRAPWQPASARTALLHDVDALIAADQAKSPDFATKIDALADEITTTFGA